MFNDSLILKIEYDTRAAMRAVKDLQREADKLGDIDLKATAAKKSSGGNSTNQNNGGSHGIAQAAAILSVGTLLKRNLLSSFDPLIKSNQQLSNALASLDQAKQGKQTAKETAAGTVEHEVKINLDALAFADTVAKRLDSVHIELDTKEAKKIFSEFGAIANREALIAKEGLDKAIALEIRALKLALSGTLRGLNKKQEGAISAVSKGTATPEQRDTFREIAAAFQNGLSTFSGAVEDSRTGIISATQNLESFADRTGGTLESTTALFAGAIEGNVVAERELASKVLQLDGSILGLTNASEKLSGKYKERGVAGNTLIGDSRVMKHFGDQRDLIGGIGSKSQQRFAESDPKLIAVFDKLRSLEDQRSTIANDPSAPLSDVIAQTKELDTKISRVNAILQDELNYRSDRLAALKDQENRKASIEASYANVLKNRPFEQPLRDIQGQRMAPQLGSANPRAVSSGSEIVHNPAGALVQVKRIIDDLTDFSFVVGFATKQVSEMSRAFSLAQGTNRGTGRPITANPGWSSDLVKLPTPPLAGYGQLIEGSTKLLKAAVDGYELALYRSAREIQLAAQEMRPLAGVKGSVRGLVNAYRSFILSELAQIGRLDVFTSPDRAKQLQKGKSDLRLAAMAVQNEAKDVPGAVARRGKSEILKPVDNIAASAQEVETLAVNTVTSGIKALAGTVLEMLREADAVARQETTKFAQKKQKTIDVRAETIVDKFSAADTPALRGETALRKLPYQALEVASSDETALAIRKLGTSAIEVAQRLHVATGVISTQKLGQVESLASKVRDSSVLAQSPGDVMAGVAAAFAFEAAGAIKTALDNSGVTEQVKTEVVRGFKSIMSNLANAMSDRATKDSEILVNALNKVNQAKTKLIAPEGKLSAAAKQIQSGTAVSTALQKVPVTSLRQIEGSSGNDRLNKDELISRLLVSGKSVDELVDSLNKLQVTQITAEVNQLYSALSGDTKGLKTLQKETTSPAVAKAAGALQDPSKRSQKLGREITEGLDLGLNPEMVTLAGTGLIASIFKAMNKEAETASPSKKAMRLGKFIVDGLKVGLSQEQLSFAAQKISKDILDGLKSGNIKEVESAYSKMFGNLTQTLKSFDINQTIGSGDATGIENTVNSLKSLEAEVLTVGRTIAENGLGLKSSNFESTLTTLKAKVIGSMEQMGGAVSGATEQELNQILKNIDIVENRLRLLDKKSGENALPFTKKSETISERKATLTGSGGTENIYVKAAATANTKAYLTAEENQTKIQRITQALGSSMYQLGGTAGAAIAGTLEPVINVLSEAGVLSGAFNKALFGVAGVATLVTFQFLNLGRESERLNARFAVIGESGAQQLRKMVALANDLGVSFQSIAETKIQVKASLVGVSFKVDADKIAKELAVVTRGFSLNKDQADRTRMGFTQGLSKGTVSMEELKQQLSEAIPGFMGDFAKSMGMTIEQTMKEVAKGGVSGEQYVKALELTAARAQPGVAAGKETLDSQVIILQNNATVLGMQLGQTALQLTKWATTGLTWVVQGFSALSPVIGTVLIGLSGGFVVALGAMTFAMLKSASAMASSSVLGQAVGAAFTNKIGLAVAGIVSVFVIFQEILKNNSTQLDKQLKDLADSFDETRTNTKKKVDPEKTELAAPQTNNNLGDTAKDVLSLLDPRRLFKLSENFGNKLVTGKNKLSQEELLTPSQKQANERYYKGVDKDNKKLQAQGILSPVEVRAAAAELQNYNAQIAALNAKKTATQQFRPNDKGAIDSINKEIKAVEKARDAYSTAKLGANNIGRLEADIESRSALIAQLEGQVRNKQQDALLQKNKELNDQQKERLRLIQDEIALQQNILSAAFARAKAGSEDTADKNTNDSNIKQSALARQQATFSKTSESFGVDESAIKLEDARKNAVRLTQQYQQMMAALDKEPQGLALLNQLGKTKLSDVTKADLAAIEAMVPGVSNKESLNGLKEFAGKLGEAKNIQNELSKAGLETAQAELQAAEAAKKLLESLRDVADVMDVIKGGFEGLQVDLEVSSLQRQNAIESSRNPFNEGDNTDTRLKKEAISTLSTEIDARKDFVRQILSLGNTLNDAENRFIKSFTNGVDPRNLNNKQLGELSARINNYKASGKSVSGNVTEYIGGLKEVGTSRRDIASKELEISKARNDMQKGVADAMKKLKDAQEKFGEAMQGMLDSLKDSLESISDELKTLQREIRDKSFDLNLQSQVQKVREAFGNGFDDSFFAQIVKAGEDFYKAIRDANNKAADGQDKTTKAIRDKNKEIRKIEEGFEKSYKDAQKQLKKAQDDLNNAQSASTLPPTKKQYSDDPNKALDQIGDDIVVAFKSKNWKAAADALDIAATRFPAMAGKLKAYQDEVNKNLQAEKAKIVPVPANKKEERKATTDSRPFSSGSVINIPGVDNTKWIKGTEDFSTKNTSEESKAFSEGKSLNNAAKETAASLTALDGSAKDTNAMYGEAQGVLAKVKDANIKFADGQNKIAQTIGQIADLDKRKAISDLDNALRNAAKAARELADALPLTILQLGQSIEEFGLGGRSRSPDEQLAADKTSIAIQTLELGKRIDDTEKSITSLTQGKMTKDQYTTFVDKFLGNIDALGLPKDKVDEIKSKLQGGFDNLAGLAESIKPATELLAQKKAALPTAVYGANSGAQERYDKTIAQGKAEVSSSKRSTFDAVADNPYFSDSYVSQRAKVYAELTEMQETYSGRLKEYIDKMYALGVSSFEATSLFVKAEEAKKASLRQSTDVLGLGLKSLGESSLTNLFSSLFTDVAGGAKTAGEAFMDFARSVVTGIAQMAAQMLAKFAIFQLMKAFFPGMGTAIGSSASGGGSSLLGSLLGGSFAKGGTIQSFAGGGEIGKALQRESAISGKPARLIVAHDGEEVLSTLNQDAQTFQHLKQSGAWESIKNSSYATGGTIGARNSRNNSNGGWEGSSGGSSTTNVYITGTTDEQSYRDNRSRVALTTKRRYG